MRTLVFALIVVCACSVARAQSDVALRVIADEYWNALLDNSPMWATANADYRNYDRLDDVSEAGRGKWKSQLRELDKRARGLPRSSLQGDDVLTLDILLRTIGDAQLRMECMQHVVPIEPLDGPQIQLPLILVSHPFRQRADFDAYVARLNGFPKYMNDQVANLRRGIALKIVAPAVIVKKAIPQIRTHIVADVTKSEFYSPVAKLDVLPEDQREVVRSAIAKAIQENVVPSFLSLLSFVEDEYLPRCRDTVGIGAVPGGDKIYEALAYLHTTTRIKPAEIHELGLAEVARIRGEMAKVQEQIGYAGTLDDFLAHMRTDRAYRFNTGDELVRSSDEFLQKAKAQLPSLFGRLPKADCVMKEIEAFRAASAPVAYYNPAAEDGSRPGYYYINTYSPQERLRFTLEALTYHEAVPGHHLQIALDQENLAIPKFRRYGGFTAYVEGWALYSEKLGYDSGGYKDLYQRFGQLTFEMWRASRLVVDTGMHLKGWTRDQAIAFMEANTSLARLDIESEIDRYIGWPGQALAYKIGELRISALRKEAQQKLGSKFDIRAFHDALLVDGAMPIELLESRMRAWIAARVP